MPECGPIGTRLAERTAHSIGWAVVDTPGYLLASTSCQHLFDGPCQRLVVHHRSTAAWQLGDLDGRVVASLVTPSAVRLPNSLVVPRLGAAPAAIWIGDGSLEWAGERLRVARWFAPARPRLPGLRSLLRPAAELSRLIGMLWLGVGGGPGLTPYADDVLAGALVTLQAAGDPGAEARAAAVLRAPLETLTTATSAGLLRLAAGGWCIDAVADFLRAIAGDQPLRPAGAALGAVGHSSGRGLREGIHCVLEPRAAA